MLLRTDTAAPISARSVDLRALQRRILRVLVGAEILAALGGSGAAEGALLALDITGNESLASLPLALLVVGSSATVVPISALSRRAGRRTGLTVSLAIAAFGAAGTVAAGVLESFALLCVASVVFGAGNTAVMLARYAAADLSLARTLPCDATGLRRPQPAGAGRRRCHRARPA